MITFSKLGNYGRFANQIWQIAACDAFATRYNTTYQIPKWKYSWMFSHEFPEVDSLPTPTKLVQEPSYGYHQNHFDKFNYSDPNVVDLLGYFQSMTYLEGARVRQLFKFKPELVDKVRNKYAKILEKPCIAVGVRRMDYVTSGNYFVLPPLYYMQALEQLNYTSKDVNIVFITDDKYYCWFHYKSLNNAHFPDFESDAEQFIFGTLCDHWVIANSTFHFWSAWLGSPKSVYQPSVLFAGDLLRREGDINFYLEDANGIFRKHDHRTNKIDLRDVTFTIPVKYDHNDRKENLELTVSLLQKSFKTNIIIGEQGGDYFSYMRKFCKYEKFELPVFHRTRMLNDMARSATTPIVVNLDADCQIAPMQLLTSVRLLRNNEADFVYPYEYLFVRVPRSHVKPIYKHYDLAVFREEMEGIDTKSHPSVGGCVLVNREKFLQAGGENEHFISYGPEDVERYERFTKLGLSCKRVRGHLYHINHWVGKDSSTSNPHYLGNQRELEKIRGFNKTALTDYINTWPWKNSTYSKQYRLEISPTATQSRDAIFNLLDINRNLKFIDFGCGVGSWGVGLNNYTGIDFGVEHDIILPGTRYIDHDLQTPISTEKSDVSICVEVAEHLEAKYADILVESICQTEANTIIFSAAIPFQGGVDHVNCQWQSYWAAKFKAHGYYPDITFRSALQKLPDVDLWYKNNLVIYRKGPIQIDTDLDYISPVFYQEIVKHIIG